MADFMEHTVERLVERAGTTFYGKYRGVVTDVDDPEDRCRIRATVPAILGEHPCGWAMPAAPFAGDGHGFVMLPKVGSGVWIEFEAGQLDNPIWSGGFWARGERPAPEGESLRVIVSEAGHKIVLDDDANELRIAHGAGPEIMMSANEIAITVGACEIKVSATKISFNNGMIEIGLAGVGLVNGAMTFGVPPT
jgi:uncharacterized protein involved in type VI secretion and phage assembly